MEKTKGMKRNEMKQQRNGKAKIYNNQYTDRTMTQHVRKAKKWKHAYKIYHNKGNNDETKWWKRTENDTPRIWNATIHKMQCEWKTNVMTLEGISQHRERNSECTRGIKNKQGENQMERHTTWRKINGKEKTMKKEWWYEITEQ